MVQAVISPFDFYLLRLPALNIDQIHQLNEITDKDDLVQALFQIYQSVEIQEAIYLASPELFAELKKWLSHHKPGTDEKLILTLYKYLLRMSTRCTPFGLFAGFCKGEITDQATDIQLEQEKARLIKHNRLDMNYVAEIAAALNQEPGIKTKLTFYPNNSLYLTNGFYRYYEYTLKNKKRDYYLVSIQSTPYIECVLDVAENGGKYTDIINALLNLSLTEESAYIFLDDVIETQLILSELEPTLTGREFFEVLTEKTQEIDQHCGKLPGLLKISEILNQEQNIIQACQAIEQIIQDDFPLAKSKDLVQTDLEIKMRKNTLNKRTISLLATELSELSALYNGTPPADLEAFRKSFYDRYEGREIPLLEALDTEAGIGYGKYKGDSTNYTPLIDDVKTPLNKKETNIRWSAFKELVFGKYQESQHSGDQTIILSENDLQQLNVTAGNMPSTLYSVGSFIANSPADIDAGNFKFNLSVFGGPSAIPLLGRFATVAEGLSEKVRESAAAEQKAHAGAILAEVIHLPEARIGNILQRPQLRDYEIPFLGKSSVDPEFQIPVTDLMVSVQNNKVVLRSKRLDQIIIPRLSSAHNYTNGISVYKFLCDLQHQDNSFSISWDWDVLASKEFLPRVAYKHIILSRARWAINSSIYKELKDLPAEEALKRLKTRYQLPSRVLLAEGDNELLLDFNCPYALQLLLQHLKKRDAVLFEFLQEKEHRLITDAANLSYLNEVIIPFSTQRQFTYKNSLTTIPIQILQRSFPLGTEWTYIKIYCGSKSADLILTDFLLPVISYLKEATMIEKWFFIRYNDPDGHLRLRFLHTRNAAITAQLITSIQESLKPLLDQRIIYKIQYETYDREIERYGERTMEFSETIFNHDSAAVINFLSLIEGVEGERYRWLFALRGADLLMNDFGLTAEQKKTMMDRLFNGFFQEFSGDTELNMQLNDKYRAISKELNSFMNPENDEEEIAEAVEFFGIRSQAIQSALYNLREVTIAEDQDKLQARLMENMSSYLHMFLNRIFIANQRKHELVIYHHLAKYYASAIAREKYGQKQDQVINS